MGPMYSVPLSVLTDFELEHHKRALTMTPIDGGYSGFLFVKSADSHTEGVRFDFSKGRCRG